MQDEFHAQGQPLGQVLCAVAVPGPELVEGVGGGGGVLGESADFFEFVACSVVEQFGDEGVLVLEVAVEGTAGVAGASGDLLDGGAVDTAFGEQLGSGGQEPGAGLLSALFAGQALAFGCHGSILRRAITQIFSSVSRYSYVSLWP